MANFSMNDRVEFIAYTQIEDEDGILEDREEVVYSCWANKKYMTNDEFVNSYATFNKYNTNKATTNEIKLFLLKYFLYFTRIITSMNPPTIPHIWVNQNNDCLVYRLLASYV